ncbi:MAG: S8 family serine peptidase, partial [Lysobacterales bacterium]
ASATPPPNNPPVANAGGNQTVFEGTTVTLDGSGSTDSDGTITLYEWTLPPGQTPAIVINNADQAVANFTAPLVGSDTDLTLSLLVKDDGEFTDRNNITITVERAISDISGTITAPAGTDVDGDVNDPNAQSIPNSTPATAQAIPNPITVGGYVNVPGAGEIGPLQASGDVSDYYRVNLIAGQTITLLVADPTIGDPDLYLWDAAGVNILDFSINVGTVESLIVPFDSEFLVEAFAFGGASNYVLIIGQTQTAGASGGFRLSDEFVPGEMIMRYSSSVALSAQQAAAQPIMSSLGLQRKGGAPDRAMLLTLNGQSNRAALLQIQDDDSGVVDRVAALANDQQRQKFETLMAIKALNREPSVEYAQPNYIAKTMAVPNDEAYPVQWHYPLINLPAAWDITTGDPSVTVAVLDTGVLLNHPDLQGQLVAGYDFVSNAQSSADGDGIDPDPDDPGDTDGTLPSSFHGTHVAGTIAAATNNSIGVAGVAGNAKIMPIRVLGRGGTTYDILKGVSYAAG